MADPRLRPDPATAARIARIERSLLPGKRLPAVPLEPATIAARMRRYEVPGLGVAVVHGGEIAWTKSYGVAAVASGRPVTERTLFQAASISKPVAAVAALRLVETGKLDLDADVNETLRSWQIPANAGWQPHVSLRHLLGHGGGLTVHGFAGYRSGTALPSLRQILDGEAPANSDPVRVDILPGTRFRYSGGGYCVLQQLIEDVTGEGFADVLRRLVFDPAGMMDSTFAQPLPPERQGDAAEGHIVGGGAVPGGWQIHPELAAAGLWTTPVDLARFTIALQRAYAGESTEMLSQAMAALLLTPRQTGSGIIGHGFFLDGNGPTARFSHGGSNLGFNCLLVAHREGGFGAVVMNNGELGADLNGEVIRAIGHDDGWPDFWPHLAPGFTPSLDDVTPEALAVYAGTYRVSDDLWFTVVVAGDRLLFGTTDQAAVPLRAHADGFFRAEVVDAEVRFERKSDGAVTGLLLRQDGEEIPAARAG